MIETKIRLATINGGYGQGGLIAYVDGDNYVKLDPISDAGTTRINRIELRSEVAGAIQNPQQNVPRRSANGTGPILAAADQGRHQLHRRVLVRRHDVDGVPGGTVTNPMASPDFGLFAFGPQADGQGDTVSFDYFLAQRPGPAGRVRVRADGPGDEFDGGTLDKTKWNHIVRERRDRYEVEDGALSVTTVNGDIYTDGDPAADAELLPADGRPRRRRLGDRDQGRRARRSAAATSRPACWPTRTTTTTSSTTSSPTTARRRSTGSSCAPRSPARSRTRSRS